MGNIKPITGFFGSKKVEEESPVDEPPNPLSSQLSLPMPPLAPTTPCNQTPPQQVLMMPTPASASSNTNTSEQPGAGHPNVQTSSPLQLPSIVQPNDVVEDEPTVDEPTLDENYEEGDSGGYVEELTEPLQPYVNAFFDWNFSALPQIYGGKPIKGKEFWQRDAKVFSQICSFPPPERLHLMPELAKFQYDAAPWVLREARLLVLDYEAFDFAYLPANFPWCECESAKPIALRRKMHRNGMVPGFRLTRGLDSCTTVIKYYSYVCDGCPQAKVGKTCRVLSGLSPKILEQLPDIVRGQYPLVGTNGWLMNIQTADFVIAAREFGLPFRAIANASLETIQTSLLSSEKHRMSLVAAQNQTLLGHMGKPPTLHGPRLVDSTDLLCLTEKMLIRSYEDRFEQQEGLIASSFLQSMKGATQLSADMNHPCGNRGTKQGHIGNMHILNDFGEVVVGQAQVSKSIKSSEKALRIIAKHAPNIGAFHTDEPRVVKTLVKTIWPKVTVMKDPWHQLAMFEDALHKDSPHYRMFWAELSAAWWVYDKGDVSRERERRIKGLPELGENETAEKREKRIAEIDKNLSDRAHLAKCSRIRHYLADSLALEQSYQTLYDQYQMTDLFNSKIHDVLRRGKTAVREFFNENHGLPTHFNSGTADDPVFHPIRGTNNNENLHRLLKGLKLHMYATKVMHALYVRALYRYSHGKRIKMRKQDLLDGVTCPVRMNELVVLQSKLKSKGLLDLEKPYFENYTVLSPEEALSGYFWEDPNSASGTALRFIEKDRQEDWFEMLPGLENSKLLSGLPANLVVTNRQDCAPFQHDDEIKLMRLLLGSNQFWLDKKLISTEGMCEETWKSLSQGKLAELADIDKLAATFNILVCTARATNESHVSVGDDKVATTNLYPKEKNHMRVGIASYACRVAHVAAGIQKAVPRIGDAAGAQASIAPTQIPLAPPIPDQPSTAPVTLPTSSVSNVIIQPILRPESEEKPQSKSKRVRTSGESVAVTGESPSKLYSNETCPECNFAKHVPHCPFRKWTLDKTKSEKVTRISIQGKQLSTIAAQRQYWLLHANVLRPRYAQSE